jgi:hypothetical protein
LEPSEGRGQVATPHKDQDLRASSSRASSSLSGRVSQYSMMIDGSMQLGRSGTGAAVESSS